MSIKGGKTSRGFTLYKFSDRYEQECSLQDSSLATEAAIWFGIDNTGPQIEGPNCAKNEEISARMHLTRDQVKELLPLLQQFAENGELPDPDAFRGKA